MNLSQKKKLLSWMIHSGKKKKMKISFVAGDNGNGD